MSTYRKKLIEVALPLEEINTASAREKSIRHGHPSTLHLWWARRPLATCRAVLFSSIIDDPGEEGVPAKLLEQIDALPLDPKYRAQLGEQPASPARDVGRDPDGDATPSSFEISEKGEAAAAREKLDKTRRFKLFTFTERLVQWENSNDPETLKIARDLILAATDGNPPPVCDPFCGGGSIPLEAQRLGLEAHASDLNPVAVLITKAMIEIPPKFANMPPVNPEWQAKSDEEKALHEWKGAQGLAEDVRYYGKWMRDEAFKRIGHLYPKVKAYRDPVTGAYYGEDDVARMWEEQNRLLDPKESLFTHPSKLIEEELTVIAWLWARTVPSPDPAARGAHIPLVRSFVLSSKKGKEAWVEPVVDRATMTYRFEVRTSQSDPRTEPQAGTIGRQGGRCILTGSTLSLNYVRSSGKAGEMSDRLMAIVAEGPNGRTYISASDAQSDAAGDARPEWRPPTELPRNPRDFKTPGYGHKTYGDLFTGRQLAALTTFSDLVGEAGRKVAEDHPAQISTRPQQEAYTAAIETYLAFAVDKGADYWSSVCSWHSSRELIRNTFGRQAIPMVWDYAECNPMSDSTGNWTACVDWVWKAVSQVPAIGYGHSEQADATKPSGESCLFSTDPPYFDNIGYADLSDFFYVWLRRALREAHSELFSTLVTPKSDELIATPYRHEGSREKATEFFENGLHKVFRRVREQAFPGYPTTVYYAFKQTETEEDDEAGKGDTASTGWESMLQGLVDSGFAVNGTWPTRTELGNRMIASGTNALASCIVLVCRPRDENAATINRREFVSLLGRELRPALTKLTQGNIAPVDLAQAAIGPGMAVFSRYASVLESDGRPMRVRAALEEINRALARVLEEQEGWYDPQTRFAVTWFEQRGFQEGPYGEAELLGTAKDAPVGTLEEAGILRARGGKVKLFTRDELDGGYDPEADRRTTIWEATQYLVRELEENGELGAARMMRRFRESRPELDIERARELAYRLYAICDRKKWPAEARGYNALGLSWSDIEAESQKEEARWDAVVTEPSGKQRKAKTDPALEGLE